MFSYYRLVVVKDCLLPPPTPKKQQQLLKEVTSLRMPLRENWKYRCDTVHDVLVTELSRNLWKPSFLNYVSFQHINQVRIVTEKKKNIK